MRVYKNKWFARKEKISDARLCLSVKDAENGLIDADYGSGLIKQRLARPNEGKSGGYRTIITYRQGDTAFFVFGFPKNSKPNLTEDEVRSYKEAANIILAYSKAELATFVADGIFEEVLCDDQNL